MKRTALATALLAAGALACNIAFSPSKDTAAVNDTVRLKVVVANIHIPCLLSIDATKFLYVKSHLAASDSVWTQLAPTKFEKSIRVVVDSVGTASVTANRKCDVRTSKGAATILVRPAAKPPPKKK